MITTVRSILVAFLTTAAVGAQSVLLSEVRADAGGRWVELHNRSALAVDLSSWSLHHASHTPSMPQEYWWAFPNGTVIAAGGYLRVHWYQAAPATPGTNELYTGSTPWNFMFSLGGEALSSVRGAFGLYRTQLGDQMGDASRIEDWISWGEHGYTREPLAIANGRWTAGRHTPAIPDGSSIARNEGAIGSVVLHDEQWFLDTTPTPLGPNLSGAGVVSYGTACAAFDNHLLGAPVLRAPSLPLLGNAQFRLAIDNSTGIYGEYVIVVWSAAAAPAGQPSLLPSIPGLCAEAIDTSQLVVVWLAQAQVSTTVIPFSLANASPALAGTEAHAQAFVLDLLPFAWTPLQGVSNALHVTFGD